MPPRKRLGQLLTELGVVDEHQLQSALGHQKQWGGKLGAVLVQKGFCKEADVVIALSKHLGMPSVKLAEAKVDPRAVKFVSRQIAEKLHVFPYEISGAGRTEVVTVAMSDPTDLSAVDQLAFHTGKRIKPMLAGDSEIIHAIHEHYADEKKPPGAPADAARPNAAPAAAAPAPQTPEFPKRVAPPAAMAPSAGAPRMTPAGGTPYIPPPIPVMAPKPAHKLEEIEPDESMSVPTPPPPNPEPLDLPPDDGQMMGLEPIAAHSQFGDAVAGQEEVAGEGSAADELEGLESAGVPHEGAEAAAAPMPGLESAAAHSQEPAPEGGWGEAAAADGWQAEAPASDFGAAQDWSAAQEQHVEGWGAEAQPGSEAQPEGEAPPAAEAGAAWGSDQGWGSEQPAESAAAEGGSTETPGEELPMDAIIGTAEAVDGTSSWGEAATAGEPAQEQAASTSDEAPQEEVQAGEPSHEHAEPSFDDGATGEADAAGEHPSAEAPDAWATSEDPLAAGGEAPAWGEGAPPEQAWGDPPADSAVDAAEPGHVVAPPTDKFAPVSAAPEAEEAPAAAETEAPPEWGEATPADVAPGEEFAAESDAPAEESAAEESAAPAEEFAAVDEESAPAAEEFAAPDGQEEPPADAPPADESADQGELKLEGWVAPPAEPEPQGTGWFGQALEATTPLSAADLGTLAAVGVDPNDGVGALRLLATLVRVLHRHQLLDPDEVANEIRESRAQASAERAAAESEASVAAPGEGGAPADEAPPEEPAET